MQKEDVSPHARDLPGEVHDEDDDAWLEEPERYSADTDGVLIDNKPSCKRVYIHITWSETAILQGTLDYVVPACWTKKQIINSVMDASATWAEMAIEEPEAKEIEDVTVLSMEVEKVR